MRNLIRLTLQDTLDTATIQQVIAAGTDVKDIDNDALKTLGSAAVRPVGPQLHKVSGATCMVLDDCESGNTGCALGVRVGATTCASVHW